MKMSEKNWYSTKSYFLRTLISRSVIDSNSLVNVCLEIFSHANPMDDIKY